MAYNMGLGPIGDSSLVFKRKFRYTLAFTGLFQVPEYFVKTASRPSLTIEDTEINFLNAKTWIPGKASWETMTVTYVDVATYASKPLYDWLASVYNFTDSVGLNQGSSAQDYANTGVLTLYDGCGTSLETWTLKNCWPSAINFQDLDNSSSDTVDIELTLRYSDVEYVNLCPGFTPDNICTPCS